MKSLISTLFVVAAFVAPLLGQQQLEGTVWDKTQEQGIPFATIGLLKQGESTVLQGNLSSEDGSFVFKELPNGTYSLKINYLGYEETVIENIKLDKDTNLGRIEMKTSSTSLDAFEVKGRREYVQYGLEKKVFNVEENLASTSGDATELLRNIPSITIDQEGNISLRGNQNIRILINGKESGLAGLDRRSLLQQIDATAIKNIEVITNPSAKYDPEGSAGIINITTKKQNKKGFNISTNLSGGTGPRLNGSINTNLKTGKWNFIAGYSARKRDGFRLGILDRTTYIDATDSLYRQYYEFRSEQERFNHNYNFGAEYIFDSNTSLSIGGNWGANDELDPGRRYSDFYDNLGAKSHYANRFEDEREAGKTREFNTNFNKAFGKLDQNLDISLRYSERDETETSVITDTFFYMDESIWYSTIQSSATDQVNNSLVFQTDYTHPFSKTSKMETGVKFNNRVFDNDYKLNNVDPIDLSETPNPAFSNNFIYTENIAAVYGIYNKKWEKFSSQFGLRYEYTEAISDLVGTNEVFRNDYHKLFPSAAFSYEFGKRQSIQATYSRRINRPRTRSLNPFTDYSDPSNIRRGNPYLLPETTNSYELSYQKSSKKGTIAASIFHKDTDQIIQRFTQIENDSVRVSTSINLSSGQNTGLELILSLRPTKWWTINTTASAYRSKLDGQNVESNLNNEGYMGTARLLSLMNFKKGFGVQYSAFYRTPSVRVQGRTDAIYSMDISVQQKILKGKGTVSLRFSDIFDTRQYSFSSSRENVFELDGTFKRQSRLLILGFRYSLQQQKRRRGGSRDRRDMGDDMDF